MNGKTWSVGSNPAPDDEDYYIKYGFGYANYNHTSLGLIQDLDVFVPMKGSVGDPMKGSVSDPKVKVNILRLKNTLACKRELKLIYYIKPVLGEDETKSLGYINSDFIPESNLIYAKNLYENDIKDSSLYISCSEKISSYTGSKSSFIGSGSIENPEGIRRVELNNENSLGQEAGICVQVNIKLAALESREITFILGAENNLLDAKNVAYKYSKINNAREELTLTKKYWGDLIGELEVSTVQESMNIILNGWMTYQTIACRLLAKSAFYQSGGATGFRDQLQDVLALKYLDVGILKNQIVKHAGHQFIDGDVQHWWHDETNRGIRTRFSDDLLWLPYAVCEYIEFTDDFSILDEEISYISGELLEEGVDEKYDIHLPSDIYESLLMHCIRAIDRSLNFGENNLPKIGSGDWNDGMSTVGNKGIGESVWLGFFLYDILDRFVPIMEECNNVGAYGIRPNENPDDVGNGVPDVPNRSGCPLQDITKKYNMTKETLQKALNTNGWDGRWYKRAFTDDGHTLGTMENEECKIDNISQTWAIISGAGDNDKKYISLDSLETHLVDKENGIIKLLDPPFDKSNLEPGYIKSYLPGVRENGGQYTHVCCGYDSYCEMY